MLRESFQDVARFHILLWLTLLTGVSGCATSYHPEAKDRLHFLSRMETHHDGEVEVSAVVLSPRETEKYFGVDAAGKGIQPVWLRIRNNDIHPYWLFPVSLDSDYYAPHEASWINHFSFSGQANRQMDRYFRENQIFDMILPGHAVSGFVYTRLDKGTKAVRVDLKSLGKKEKLFLFALPVPGMALDRDEVDFDRLYDPGRIEHIQTLDDLRKWIEELPCCVYGKEGTKPGDPLNLVFVGSEKAVFSAFVQRHWHPTEKLDLTTVAKTALAFLKGSRYPYSPISPLYLFGRKQDWALQKARETINERNHLRLWLAPVRFQGKAVWVGQISRDIGVRLTGRLDPPTTHVIDPEVDEARLYLLQDLVLSSQVYRGGFAKGVGVAYPYAPRTNLLGDPYYTDGLRLVLFIDEEPVSFEKIEELGWELEPLIDYLVTDDD